MGRRRLRFAALALLALVLAGCTLFDSTEQSPSAEPCATSGCPVRLITKPQPGPGEACEAAHIGGVLTPDPTYGLGLSFGGAVHGVIWPFGYSARHEPGGVVLIDRSGQIVAREGDHIGMTGVKVDGTSYPCFEPNIEVVP